MIPGVTKKHSVGDSHDGPSSSTSRRFLPTLLKRSGAALSFLYLQRLVSVSPGQEVSRTPRQDLPIQISSIQIHQFSEVFCTTYWLSQFQCHETFSLHPSDIYLINNIFIISSQWDLFDKYICIFYENWNDFIIQKISHRYLELTVLQRPQNDQILQPWLCPMSVLRVSVESLKIDGETLVSEVCLALNSSILYNPFRYYLPVTIIIFSPK